MTNNRPGLDWQPGATVLSGTRAGDVILISHNRSTWKHADEARNNCVVVTRQDMCDPFADNDEDISIVFSQFGPDQFDPEEIAAWARFDGPPVEMVNAHYRR